MYLFIFIWVLVVVDIVLFLFISAFSWFTILLSSLSFSLIILYKLFISSLLKSFESLVSGGICPDVDKVFFELKVENLLFWFCSEIKVKLLCLALLHSSNHISIIFSFIYDLVIPFSSLNFFIVLIWPRILFPSWLLICKSFFLFCCLILIGSPLLLSFIIVSLSFSLFIYFVVFWILKAYSPDCVFINFISFGICGLLTWKTSTVLFSLINLLFLVWYIFSVIFSPVFLTLNLLVVFGFKFLKTSTFLVSTTILLFFPGYLFSVIFSPCFIKSLRNSLVGFEDDFDLIVESFV